MPSFASAKPVITERTDVPSRVLRYLVVLCLYFICCIVFASAFLASIIAVVIMSYVVGLPNLQLPSQITIADLTKYLVEHPRACQVVVDM